MKFLLMSFFVLLMISNAFALQSRTEEIDSFNSQARAMTMLEICKLIQSKDVNWGTKSSLSCKVNDDSTLTIVGISSKGKSKIDAISVDKAVIEFFGFDEIHQYKNDQNESIKIVIELVPTKTKRWFDGILIKGKFRGTAIFNDQTDKVHKIGYYIQN